MKLIKTLQFLCLAAGVSMFTINAAAQKLYKWVDADGNISYQDQAPPENAKVLDEIDIKKKAIKPSGSVIRTDPIKVYTVDDCAACDQSVSHLVSIGVPHVVLPLGEDREAQSMIMERTSSVIVPTILIGETLLQSPTNDALSAAVEKAGYKIGE